MEIVKTNNEGTFKVALTGRLDTTTAPSLEEVIKELDNVNNFELDFKGLEYVSSAGLRVLLAMQKKMNTQGKMVIKNVSADIMEVFDMTGFSDILTIE